MPAPLLLLALLAAPQPAAPPAASHGRVFISPMGEPFYGGGSDGLTVWFQQGDSNRDGILTRDELRKDAERFFLRLDLNHDGEIDPDEIENYENVIAPEVRTGSGWGRAGIDSESTGGGRLGVLSIPEPVATADSNLDRGVSNHEFQTAAEKRFGMLDFDHDGRLTLVELQTARSAVRSNARHPHRDSSPNDSDQSQTGGDPAGGGG